MKNDHQIQSNNQYNEVEKMLMKSGFSSDRRNP